MLEEGVQQLGQWPGTRVFLEAEVKVSLRKQTHPDCKEIGIILINSLNTSQGTSIRGEHPQRAGTRARLLQRAMPRCAFQNYPVQVGFYCSDPQHLPCLCQIPFTRCFWWCTGPVRSGWDSPLVLPGVSWSVELACAACRSLCIPSLAGISFVNLSFLPSSRGNQSKDF